MIDGNLQFLEVFALTPTMTDPTVKFVQAVSGVRKKASVWNTAKTIRWRRLLSRHELRPCSAMEAVILRTGLFERRWFGDIFGVLEKAVVIDPKLA